MIAFVTGGTGFIGRRLVRGLVEGGYQVRALARSPRSAAVLAELGATAVPGNILDEASLQAGIQGSDVVFHLAAAYPGRGASWPRVEIVNVDGARNVLRLAHALGVPKIIYASTVNVFGDTHGQSVHEDYFYAGPFRNEYARTKWLAHYKVALPLLEKGAPIVIVLPGGVYGPGDCGFLAEAMRFFYRGVPFAPGPETILTYAYVDDVAQGFMLAAARGKVGESYILAGPAIPLGEMMDFWAHLTGRPAPPARVPAGVLRPLAPLMEAVESFVGIPAVFSPQALSILGTTSIARSDKARAELGWQTRPLQTGMLETFEWIAETEEAAGETAVADLRLRQAASLALAAGLFLTWRFTRRRRRSASNQAGSEHPKSRQ
jgi:dihydroflavonol-4-reductase